MFCNNCGFLLRDTAKFCPNCGKPVDRPRSTQVDGSKPVDLLPLNQGDLMKVYQYNENLCVIRGEGSPLRYIQSKVDAGQRQVEFEFEPDNEYDSQAVAVTLDGIRIGYVYRGQTQDMIHNYYERGFEVAAHINTFTNEKITCNIGFYKPKSKCHANRVSYRSSKFFENNYGGEILEVVYDAFDECYYIRDCGEEYKLPKAAERYASEYYSVPVEVGEDCESLIFYK